jgi:hypothetical protein
MRLSVLIYVPSARELDGRRPAISLIKEYRARFGVSRISPGWLIRFVALLVRFTGKIGQSTTRSAGSRALPAEVAQSEA